MLRLNHWGLRAQIIHSRALKLTFTHQVQARELQPIDLAEPFLDTSNAHFLTLLTPGSTNEPCLTHEGLEQAHHLGNHGAALKYECSDNAYYVKCHIR